MGIDQSDTDNIGRNRPKKDFDVLVGVFIEDLLKGNVNSRSKKTDINEYARKLMATPGQSGQRTEAESLSSSSSPKSPIIKKQPKISLPIRVKHIRFEKEIYNRLLLIESKKLESLYYSICSVSLDEHTPLIAVGVWSFIESLTACAGRNSNTDFLSFLSKHKLDTYGLGDGKSTVAIREAIDRILKNGNTTKHHEVSANFYGEQLANDMETLRALILKCADEAIELKE